MEFPDYSNECVFCRMSVDMKSARGFKTLFTPVGPSMRHAFDVNFDEKFHQLFSPALQSKHVAGKSCDKNGVCSNISGKEEL